MDAEAMKARTKQFALRVVRLVASLPKTQVASMIGGQLLDAGTSVGANYRAACRARSRAEFAAKLGIVEEETDESLYWMEMLVDAGIVPLRKLALLMQEGHEILSIVVSSLKTTRGRQR